MLIATAIRRVGHQPITHDGLEPDMSVDAAVIEPGEPTGIAVASKLREQRIRFVFVSIFPPEPEALELQPAAYLVKPFSLAALQTALAAALA
jgi:CheY-like chemotaxis protein